MSESAFKPSGGDVSLEIPTARYDVGVVFNAEVMGFRSHLFQNVPNTELGKLIQQIRTVGCPIFADEGKREVMVMPTGILALDIKLKEDEPVDADKVEVVVE